MAVLDKLRLADLTKLSGCAAPSMQPSTSYRNVIFPSPGKSSTWLAPTADLTGLQLAWNPVVALPQLCCYADHWVELHNSPRLSDKQQAQMVRTLLIWLNGLLLTALSIGVGCRTNG